jgi:multiple sugar transport system substrate-binding protein
MLKKSTIIGIIFLVIMGGTFAGASELSVWNCSAMKSDPGTLVIGEVFEKENPGVKVKFTGVPYQGLLTQSTSEFFAGGKTTSFDVNEATEMWFTTYVENGWITPLDKYIDASFIAKFPKSIVEALTFEGKLYAVPHYINMPLFYYNKDMLKKAGYDKPPQTWEELKEYSQKLTKGDQYGFAAPLYRESDTLYFLMTYFYQAGGRVYDANKNIAFNSPEGLKAVQFLVDMYKAGSMPKGVISLDCFKVADLFRQRKVAMMINWAFEIQNNLKPDSPVKDEFAVASHPAGPAGQKITAAPWLYVVSERSKNKEMAINYLKTWMNSELLSGYVTTEPGKVIPLTALYDNPDVKAKVPFFDVIRDNIDNFVLETGPKKEEIAIILVKEVNKALTGEKSPEQALQDAEQLAKALF